MRAVGITVYGGPEALEVVDLPEVHAGPGQVRISWTPQAESDVLEQSNTLTTDSWRAAPNQDNPQAIPTGNARKLFFRVSSGE